MFEVLLDPIVHRVIEAAVMAAATAVVTLLVQAARKVHLHLSEVQAARLRYYAQQAARYAESRIEALVKAGVLKLEHKAEAKAKEALTFLLGKVPGLDAAKAQQAIEAELLALGLGAAAAPAVDPFGSRASQ